MTTSRSEARTSAGLLGRVNHVGVAVPDMAAALSRYRDLFGERTVAEPFDLPAQGVSVCFVDAGGTQIELVAPLGASSPLGRFLERNPEGGQHHICHEVADIARAQAAFAERGVRALGSPRMGAHDSLVLFLHPKDTGGVLLELMERREGHAHE